MAESVKEDLKWLRAHEVIRDQLRNNARGFLFDIKTGKVEEIKA
jgi:carbonic anhydrase